MSNKKTCHFGLIIGLVSLAALFLLIAGCASPPAAGDPASPTAEQSVPPGEESAKGSAQLWSENCMRCHNMRSPSSYSDAEWEVAMQHMRLRAGLTAEEHRRILEFLQSAN
jgi:hypothetical protein